MLKRATIVALMTLVGVAILPPEQSFASGAEVYLPLTTNIFTGPTSAVSGTVPLVNTPIIDASGLDAAHTYTWSMYIYPQGYGVRTPLTSMTLSGVTHATIMFASPLTSGFGAWEVYDDIRSSPIASGLYADPPASPFFDSTVTNIGVGNAVYSFATAGGYQHQGNRPEIDMVAASSLGFTTGSILFYTMKGIDCATITTPADASSVQYSMASLDDYREVGTLNGEDILEYNTAVSGGDDAFGIYYLYVLRRSCLVGFIMLSDASQPPARGANAVPYGWDSSTPPLQFDLPLGVYQYACVSYCLAANFTTRIGTSLFIVSNQALPPLAPIVVSIPRPIREGADAKILLTNQPESEYWRDLDGSLLTVCAFTCNNDSNSYLYAPTIVLTIVGVGSAGDTAGVEYDRYPTLLPFTSGALTNIQWGYNATAFYTVAITTLLSDVQDEVTFSPHPDAQALLIVGAVALIGAALCILSPILGLVVLNMTLIAGVWVLGLDILVVIIVVGGELLLAWILAGRITSGNI